LTFSLKFSIGLMLLLMSFFSFGEDKSIGCGPGSILVPRKSILSTSIAKTIDASSYGLGNIGGTTSGTSGCARHQLVRKEHEKSLYVASNLPQIKLQSAIGEGEHLTALGLLYGCGGKEAQAFSKFMKVHFKSIFTTHESQGIVQNIHQGLSNSVQGCII